NFLLQVRGTKQVSIWNPNDRGVITEQLVESHLEAVKDPSLERYLPWNEDFQQRAEVYQLNPGEGLHFPFGAPHWVKNGSHASVHFSIALRSDFSERLGMVYYMNNKLRGFGLNPLPPAHSSSRDGLKIAAFRTARGAKRMLRGGNR